MWEKEKKTMQVKETENKGVEVEETTGQEIKTGNGELTEEGENPKGESWVAIPAAPRRLLRVRYGKPRHGNIS